MAEIVILSMQQLLQEMVAKVVATTAAQLVVRLWVMEEGMAVLFQHIYQPQMLLAAAEQVAIAETAGLLEVSMAGLTQEMAVAAAAAVVALVDHQMQQERAAALVF